MTLAQARTTELWLSSRDILQINKTLLKSQYLNSESIQNSKDGQTEKNIKKEINLENKDFHQ